MEAWEFLRVLLVLSLVFPITGLVICTPFYWLFGPTFLHPRIKPSRMKSFAESVARPFNFTGGNEKRRSEIYVNVSLATHFTLALFIGPFLILPIKLIGIVSVTGFTIGIIVAPFILLKTTRKETASLSEIFSGPLFTILMLAWLPVLILAGFLPD